MGEISETISFILRFLTITVPVFNVFKYQVRGSMGNLMNLPNFRPGSVNLFTICEGGIHLYSLPLMWITVLGRTQIKVLCLPSVPLGNLKGKNKINNYTTSQLEGRGFHW